MKLADLLEDVAEIRELLRRLDKPTLETLLRRGRHVTAADGYRTTRGRERVDGSGGDTQFTTVETAANSRIGIEVDDDGNVTHTHPPADPVGDDTAKIVAWVTVMAKSAHPVRTKLDNVLLGHERQAALKALSGYCQGCDKPVSGQGADPTTGKKADRLEAGYCHTCFVAWGRAGRPERYGFNLTRRAHSKPPGQPGA